MLKRCQSINFLTKLSVRTIPTFYLFARSFRLNSYLAVSNSIDISSLTVVNSSFEMGRISLFRIKGRILFQDWKLLVHRSRGSPGLRIGLSKVDDTWDLRLASRSLTYRQNYIFWCDKLMRMKQGKEFYSLSRLPFSLLGALLIGGCPVDRLP